MSKINCAVIGVGYLGKFHAEKYTKIEQANLVAVVDADKTNAQDLAKKFNCTALTDYRDLIGKVDAVSIAAPTKLHFEIAKTLLENKIHVLVEKPITATLEQANILIDTAQQQHVLLQVGHLERFNPAVIALAGLIEQPLFIESHRIAPFTPRGSDVNVVLDIMIHDIDLIHSMVKSSIKRISANGVPVLTQEIDICNARLEFENGAVANVTASRAGLKTERKMRIFSNDAYVSMNLHEKKLSIYRKGEGQMFAGIPNIKVKKHKLPKGDAILDEIKAFLNSIANNLPAVVSGEDGKHALQIAHDITTAIHENLKIIST
jgi:predicted dehydrogenase